MSRPLWLVQLIKMAFPGRFLAARATRVPIVGGLINRLLFDGDRIFYLPKDRLIPVGERVPPQVDMVLPSQVVEHFIEQAGTRWVMNTCICREAHRCRDYPVDLGCLFLGQAAAGINPKLGRPVTKEEALDHVRRCREAGLVHMIGRNKLDTVWLGVGPGTHLLTICNCCPCCCLWQMLPHLAPEIGRRVTRMPGVSVAVTERCIGCGTCTKVCFVKAIHVEDGRAFIGDACRGCGRCVEACPQKAIELSVDYSQAVAQSIARIAPLVDVS
jgi:ferredoxin